MRILQVLRLLMCFISDVFSRKSFLFYFFKLISLLTSAVIRGGFVALFMILILMGTAVFSISRGLFLSTLYVLLHKWSCPKAFEVEVREQGWNSLFYSLESWQRFGYALTEFWNWSELCGDRSHLIFRLPQSRMRPGLVTNISIQLFHVGWNYLGEKCFLYRSD